VQGTTLGVEGGVNCWFGGGVSESGRIGTCFKKKESKQRKTFIDLPNFSVHQLIKRRPGNILLIIFIAFEKRQGGMFVRFVCAGRGAAVCGQFFLKKQKPHGRQQDKN
jgi:hypothetical protein